MTDSTNVSTHRKANQYVQRSQNYFLLLTVPRRLLCCSSSFMDSYLAFVLSLFLSSPSFGGSGRLCLVIMAFSGTVTYSFFYVIMQIFGIQATVLVKNYPG